MPLLNDPKESPEDLDLRKRWASVLMAIQQFIPGLSIDYLMINLHNWVEGSTNLNWIGRSYERLIASGLCLNYFQRRLTSNLAKNGYIPFIDLYNIKNLDSQAGRLLSKFLVNLSQGIETPMNETRFNDIKLNHAVILNEKTNNAHHDMILPGIFEEKISNAAIQAKNSLEKPDGGSVSRQLDAPLLFWFYLDAPDDNSPVQFQNQVVKTAILEEHIAFLSGSGCINPCSLQLMKALRDALKHFPIQTTFAEGFQIVKRRVAPSANKHKRRR